MAIPAPNRPMPLLAGMSPRQFMQQHWQKKPLLVRQTGLDYPLHAPTPAEVRQLAAADAVTSRLVLRNASRWAVHHGPFGAESAQALPNERSTAPWTVLVQGVDRVHPATHALLQRFRFLPDARLDDAMLSLANHGGGVGPHVDSYDVFLLQVHGQRRWQIAKQRDVRFKAGLPLKILASFEPTEEHLLRPGDMLYLPPGWAHDGVAVGDDCVTCSIGFRAPSGAELLKEMLYRAIDEIDELEPDEALAKRLNALYADPEQTTSAEPARVPPSLQAFNQQALQTQLAALLKALQPDCALGEYLSQPHSGQDFAAKRPSAKLPGGVVLHAASRMLFDSTHIFLNGQSWRAGGADARLMRRLANARSLDAASLQAASTDAQALLRDWLAQGWLVAAAKASSGQRHD